ncbi:hypothetical protein JKP88DRAFT_314287 [Tribonema minus]|uniref:SMP domain-containing protein n=1 Tax=Tribonema minus TaxID=303371 RepID=A0A835Z426_9STRA|nr:hypothetical protein JKP88DRAFT_314287 [Tribonema minus]
MEHIKATPHGLDLDLQNMTKEGAAAVQSAEAAARGGIARGGPSALAQSVADRHEDEGTPHKGPQRVRLPEDIADKMPEVAHAHAQQAGGSSSSAQRINTTPSAVTHVTKQGAGPRQATDARATGGYTALSSAAAGPQTEADKCAAALGQGGGFPLAGAGAPSLSGGGAPPLGPGAGGSQPASAEEDAGIMRTLEKQAS